MPDYPTTLTGLPSGRKVLLRLKDFFEVAAADAEEGAPGHGVQFFIDRPFEAPFQDIEMAAGAVHIRLVDTNRAGWDGTTLIHSADIAFDIGTAEGESNSIGALGAEIEAWMIGLLHSDITIGGLTKDAISRAVTADEQLGADAGILISAAELSWLTPRTDLFTIIGPFGRIS